MLRADPVRSQPIVSDLREHARRCEQLRRQPNAPRWSVACYDHLSTCCDVFRTVRRLVAAQHSFVCRLIRARFNPAFRFTVESLVCWLNGLVVRWLDCAAGLVRCRLAGLVRGQDVRLVYRVRCLAG